jgi:predicted nucleic acid-binding protein
MARILFDTDVLIDHFQDASSRLPAQPDGAYSTITRAELYSGTSVREEVVDEMLDHLSEIEVDRTVAEEAGRIRRSIRIKLPDALIAATATTTGRTLVTRNVRDFKKVKGLKVQIPGR